MWGYKAGVQNTVVVVDLVECPTSMHKGYEKHAYVAHDMLVPKQGLGTTICSPIRYITSGDPQQQQIEHQQSTDLHRALWTSLHRPVVFGVAVWAQHYPQPITSQSWACSALQTHNCLTGTSYVATFHV